MSEPAESYFGDGVGYSLIMMLEWLVIGGSGVTLWQIDSPYKISEDNDDPGSLNGWTRTAWKDLIFVNGGIFFIIFFMSLWSYLQT